MRDISPKTYHFISAVQTAVGIEMLPRIEPEQSVGWLSIETISILDDAFDVATRIPPEVTAHEAALLFVAYRLGHKGEEEPTYPAWLYRV